MKKKKPQDKQENWKMETVGSLRQYARERRLYRLLEIIYHTILPVTFTFWLLQTQNPMFFLPIIIIMFVRLKVK